MKTPTKTKTRIHDNWLAGYNGLEDATKTSKKSPKKKSSKKKKKSPKKKSSKIYVKLNNSPT